MGVNKNYIRADCIVLWIAKMMNSDTPDAPEVGRELGYLKIFEYSWYWRRIHSFGIADTNNDAPDILKLSSGELK